MIYRIRNNTLGKWVLDEDGNVCVLHSQREADVALARVNDLKRVNPDHKDDEFEIVTYGVCPICERLDCNITTHKAYA